jgi:hypothetical protein
MGGRPMAWLFLQVVGWSQTIAHGEDYPPSQRVIARTSDDEDLLFGADGCQRLRNMPVHLNLVRGQPEEPPERGIGVLEYYPERPPSPPDFDGIDQFVGGWFWLPEASYDEIWTQAREHRYDEGVIEIEFEPVESAGEGLRWNTVKNKVASITSVGVRFERRLKTSGGPDEPSSGRIVPPSKSRAA